MKKVWLFFIFPREFFCQMSLYNGWFNSHYPHRSHQQPHHSHLHRVTHNKAHTTHLESQMVNCQPTRQKWLKMALDAS